MNRIIEMIIDAGPAVIIGQALGIIGMILAMISFQCKNIKVFCALQTFSGLSFTVHFFVLGNAVQGALNMFNILRGWAFGFSPRKYRTAITVSLIIMFTVATVFTYAGWLSILVLAAQIVGTAVMRTDSGKIIRIVQLSFVSPAWLIHNILCGSIGAIFCEVFNITSIIVSIARFGINGFTGTDEGKSETEE